MHSAIVEGGPFVFMPFPWRQSWRHVANPDDREFANLSTFYKFLEGVMVPRIPQIKINSREFPRILNQLDGLPLPFNRIGADGALTPADHYDLTALELKLRYGYGEKFYQTRTQRIPITYDAFIFNLSHTMARKGFLGSSYDLQRTEVGMQKRFWFSAFGYLDAIVKGGKVWTKVPYPLLILPNANTTYTIQPETYTNMNALEFINDEYLSWDLTYYMNGILLNRIPLLKKLRWREVFCFRGLWGHLTDKNDPAKSGGEGLYAFPSFTQRMGRAPYMEASVGIENIFNFLRLDYVWRLNYRGNPDIQKHGIRATMKLSF